MRCPYCKQEIKRVPKVHFQYDVASRWASLPTVYTVTACGYRGDRVTRDRTKVTCQMCERTHAYGEAAARPG